MSWAGDMYVMLPSPLACRSPRSISSLRSAKVPLLGDLGKASFPQVGREETHILTFSSD